MKSFVSSLASTVWVLFLWAVFSVTPTHATRYVSMDDGDLADQARIIAEVRVLSIDRSAGSTEPMTEYQVALERLIKGDVIGRALAVRVRGGELADGTELYIHGAPRFVEGERALLFLKPWGDGTYGILHLMLGAFHVVEQDGREVVMRRFAEAREVELPGMARGRGGPRSLDRFGVWLADRARGLARPADYFVAPVLPGKFTITTAPSGNKIRWQDFDSGGDVGFRAHEDGQPGLAGGGFTEFQAAIAAWNSDPSTPIDIRYEGTTTADGGLITFDGVQRDPIRRRGAFRRTLQLLEWWRDRRRWPLVRRHPRAQRRDLRDRGRRRYRDQHGPRLPRHWPTVDRAKPACRGSLWPRARTCPGARAFLW